ncbi:hypothetical protein P154DRAFT_457374, partial [Amniculicola lignicola CBS 123094]
MSKTKAKRARREAKREESRKFAPHARKAAKPSSTTGAAASNAQTPKLRPGLKGKEIREEVRRRKVEAAKGMGTGTGTGNVQASQKHAIPFGVYDRILLVGEGDFSMTRCLAVEIGCADVTGTSFDSEEEVREKYPTFPTISTDLSALTPPVPLHHTIDATKLSTYKTLKPPPNHPWDTIAFLFPHVGGLSTDVNRQVRSNQALLVSFFKSCLEVPTTDVGKATFSSAAANANPRPFLKMGGKVIVTLFEGEPYTLWNIRDLARHCGLKVVESFKFDWGMYPGYGHVRTLGAIEGGGAWRGEEREARM